MISLLKILSEIKMVDPLNISADIIIIDYEDDEGTQYDEPWYSFDFDKIELLLIKYRNYFKDLKFKGRIIDSSSKKFESLVNYGYIPNLDLNGEPEEYNGITIKQLLEDFKQFIKCFD